MCKWFAQKMEEEEECNSRWSVSTFTKAKVAMNNKMHTNSDHPIRREQRTW